MSDLIEREDAIEATWQEPTYTDPLNVLTEVRDRIESIPSADRPRGEWIRTFDGNEWYWYCSNCKEQWYEEDLWMGGNEFPHFCPNCGARMKGADDEDA